MADTKKYIDKKYVRSGSAEVGYIDAGSILDYI